MIVCFDNGVTGSFAVYKKGKFYFYKTPIKRELDYNKKKKKFISRIDINELNKIFNEINVDNERIFCYIERPFININYKFFNSVLSSFRAFEAMLIFFDINKIGYEVVDSKEWQKYIFGKTKNIDKKKLSLELGNRYYPEFKDVKINDRDSLLMLKYVLENKIKME